MICSSKHINSITYLNVTESLWLA